MGSFSGDCSASFTRVPGESGRERGSCIEPSAPHRASAPASPSSVSKRTASVGIALFRPSFSRNASMAFLGSASTVACAAQPPSRSA
ncbi:MAG: hypothetical protein QM765_46270 [Myxococcales bacterium]